MHVGTHSVVITPPLGTRLAGYGHRDHGAEAVLDDLELRVFWLADEAGTDTVASAAGRADASTACIIAADLIGFDAGLTEEIRAELSGRFGLSPGAVVLAASHTHSGPQTCANMQRVGGPPDPKIVAALRQSISDAVAAAREACRPVTLEVGQGRLEGYAINRRVLVAGEAVMAPNPQGVRDDEVKVLAFRDRQSGRIAGVLFHYTCHPTILGDYRISADYPGAARRHIERCFQGAVAAFLPGCFGDIRPNCTVIGGRKFRAGQPADIAAFGSALGAEVVRVVLEAGSPAQPQLFAQTTELRLPLATPDTHAALSLQRLDIADRVRLVALGGEICVDYGLFVKSLQPEGAWWPVGYSNGMVGYVPSARLFPERGYEVERSCPYFDLPAPFAPEIDDIIRTHIHAFAMTERSR